MEHVEQCTDRGCAVSELQQRGPLIKVVSSNIFNDGSFVAIHHDKWTDEPAIGWVLVASGKDNSHIYTSKVVWWHLL